jgi:hypothetical protein
VERLCTEFENANKACLYLLKPFLFTLLPAAVEAVLVLDVDLRVLPGGSLREVLGQRFLRALRRLPLELDWEADVLIEDASVATRV